MIRKQVYLTHDQDKALKRLAQRRAVTESDVIRSALDRFLGEEVPRRDPFEELIGMFSGPEKVDHDDIYRR